MNQQHAATNISRIQNLMHHSSSVYENAVSPMYTNTNASAANPIASTVTDEFYLLWGDKLYQA